MIKCHVVLIHVLNMSKACTHFLETQQNIYKKFDVSYHHKLKTVNVNNSYLKAMIHTHNKKEQLKDDHSFCPVKILLKMEFKKSLHISPFSAN